MFGKGKQHSDHIHAKRPDNWPTVGPGPHPPERDDVEPDDDRLEVEVTNRWIQEVLLVLGNNASPYGDPEFDAKVDAVARRLIGEYQAQVDKAWRKRRGETE